jgi:hypothetical protein
MTLYGPSLFKWPRMFLWWNRDCIHNRFVEFFHLTMEAFLDYKQGDMNERRMFRDHGIFLLEIPYTVSSKVMRDFITRACTRRGIKKRDVI